MAGSGQVGFQLGNRSVDTEAGGSGNLQFQVVAGDLAGLEVIGAGQSNVGQGCAGENDRNVFGRRQVLLGFNPQRVAVNGRFDKRQKVLVGGNVERRFAAGPSDLVSAGDLDLGKISY